MIFIVAILSMCLLFFNLFMRDVLISRWYRFSLALGSTGLTLGVWDVLAIGMYASGRRHGIPWVELTLFVIGLVAILCVVVSMLTFSWGLIKVGGRGIRWWEE